MTELRAKRTARIRDKFTCRLCQTNLDGNHWRLHGHHIRPKALYPDLAADPGNLVTLCMVCHLWTVHAGSISDGASLTGNWRQFVFMFRWLIR